ncbi:endo-1,4-beta-xylanase [Aristaeella lactis]|uniref:Endo-1,4-beta-xylanase n=1 Tax=Aristaeella lactis TaxID=3046383 RepID=A0AC61PQW9_9FIRM|nr:endo-1,4-beta-xylanase [Aristaeella lactis]QUA54163.1 endo-1,4-beta-xylanase [Aristaeella lactis]SMC93705.1 endo-1,4-beta-xylanase [Aristaeella lactis]
MIKKLLAFLMILSLLGSSMLALADDAKTVYTSDFTKDEDGWYGRGAMSFHTADGTLKTVGRQSAWNSPGRDFPLIEGGKYDLSVEVKQDDLDSANFMISIAHTIGGAETYENLAHGTAKKGEWTTLTGSYTAGDFSRYVLYVETTGADTLDFEIRNFTVTAPEGEPEPKPTEPPMVIEEAGEVPSLKEIYADSFDFGSAAPQMVFRDPKWLNLMKTQFSILTPENEMKPDSVLDVNGSRKLLKETGDETAVAVHFDAAKALLRFAQQNGIKVHGHVLVWHSQTPEAFFHEGYDTKKPYVKRDVMLGRLENYIKGVFEFLDENYPGVVVSWDVLNEAIDDGSNWLRNSNWRKIIGDDFPNYAYAYARKYAPEGTKLYYNDYNTAIPGKLNGIVKLLKSLIPEGNIDGYGFQMHHSATFPSIQQIKTAVETIADLGISLRVSELDVTVDNNSEASFKKQAHYYADVMKILIAHKDQFEAVQVWGLTDMMSWRGSQYPLLFDGNGNPKPAFWAVADPETYQ